MSITSITLTCDWCTATEQVDLDLEMEDEAEFVIFRPRVPSWFRLESGDDEKDYCCRDCLISDL